jgi:hypothetical protein
MSREEHGGYRGPREEDMEKALEPKFRGYEEWRAKQMAAEPPSEKKEVKKGFGKQDILFIIVGFLAVTLYQSCRGAAQ